MNPAKKTLSGFKVLLPLQGQRRPGHRAHNLTLQSACCYVFNGLISRPAIICSILKKDHGSPTTGLGTALPVNPLKENEKYVKVADIGVGASAFVVLAQERVTLTETAIKFIDRGTTA